MIIKQWQQDFTWRRYFGKNTKITVVSVAITIARNGRLPMTYNADLSFDARKDTRKLRMKIQMRNESGKMTVSGIFNLLDCDWDIWSQVTAENA